MKYSEEAKMTPRGIRNNNPGNIRINSIRYQGELVPSGDAAFKQFKTMAYGVRALFMILYTYQVKHGLKTIAQMIGRWAPPSENNTSAYADYVSRAMGRTPDSEVNALRRDDMIPFARALIRYENGQSVGDASIDDGWELFQGAR